MAVVAGLIVGWLARPYFDADKFEESVSEVETEAKPETVSLIQEFIQSSPSYIYNQEEFPANRETPQYLGQIGNYKVVKYFAEFGASSKALQKVVFYSNDNSYIGYYLPYGDLGQVYPHGDSIVIDHQVISLASALPDSVLIGPELYLKLFR